MFAEIITIGDEILIGQIVDTNSAFISSELNKIGVSVYQITSVQDDKAHILKALEEAKENADIIILTGGLGPTKDDITKSTIAEFFQDTLIQSDEVLENIKRLWRDYVKQPLQQVNINQALIPSKSIPLMNYLGSAPGMWIEDTNKVFISLPGVPYEMKALMKNSVLPKLKDKYHLPFIYHKTLLTYGLGESMLAERIEDWETNLPSFVKLAYLPNLGKVRLRLSAKGDNENEIVAEVEKQIENLLPQIEDIFIGFEDETNIQKTIGELLAARNQTLVTAESCTGGTIAQAITSNQGSSAYYKGSIVSYATETKIDVLKVDKKLIEAFSVVSKEVAEAMATNVKQLLDADYAIAVTGNAGPTKGDSDADVGTVWIAIATPTNVFSEVFNFGNSRTKVVNRASNKAFELLYKEIFKK